MQNPIFEHFPIQTRWNSGIPQGPIIWKFKESASHHIICFAQLRAEDMKNSVESPEGNQENPRKDNFENF